MIPWEECARRAIAADTALRLSRYFGASVEMWMGLQADYEVEKAHNVRVDREEKEVRARAA